MNYSTIILQDYSIIVNSIITDLGVLIIYAQSNGTNVCFTNFNSCKWIDINKQV